MDNRDEEIKELLIATTKASLDKTLEFYSSFGTPLNYRPKLHFTDKLNPHIPNAIACCKADETTLKITSQYAEHAFGKLIWKEVYGLKISDAAYNQQASVDIKLRETPVEFDKDIDILLYRPYKDRIIKILNGNKGYISNIEEVISHEVWHLIELQDNVFLKSPLITEGTATYSSIKFSGVKKNNPIEQCKNFQEMIYAGGANLVEKYVGDSPNPFKMLHDESLRAQMQQELLDRTTPLFEKLFCNYIKTDNFKKGITYSLNKIPQYKELQGNLTKENLLNVYRKLGAVLIADELEGQDLGKLLQMYKNAGF